MGHYVIPRKIKAKVAYEEDFLQGSPFLKGFLLPNYEFDSLYPQPHLPILQIHFMNKTYTDSKSNWKTDCNLGSTSSNKSSKLKSRQKIYWSFFHVQGKNWDLDFKRDSSFIGKMDFTLSRPFLTDHIECGVKFIRFQMGNLVYQKFWNGFESSIDQYWAISDILLGMQLAVLKIVGQNIVR